MTIEEMNMKQKAKEQRSQQILGKTFHRVSPLPTTAFAFFGSPKLSLDIINTSLSSLVLSLRFYFIIAISNNNLCLQEALRCLHLPLVSLQYIRNIFLSVHWERRRQVCKPLTWVLNGKERCGKRRKGSVFRCKADSDTRDASQLREINRSQIENFTSGLLIMGFIRCSKTYADKWSHIKRVIR